MSEVLTEAYKNSLKPVKWATTKDGVKVGIISEFAVSKENLLYPKPAPKKRKTMIDYANKLYTKNIEVAKDGHLRVKRATTIAKLKKLRNSGHISRAELNVLKRDKKKKLPSIKSLKLKADAVFSIFIRSRDGNKCVLCGSTKNVQCGHLIKRGKMATRYDELNCNALCSGCNYKDNFEHDHYVVWFIMKHGFKLYAEMLLFSKTIKQMKRQDFLKIIKKYEKI